VNGGRSQQVGTLVYLVGSWEEEKFFKSKILESFVKFMFKNYNQCFGSVFGFNQVRGSGSGSRRAKITHKKRKKKRNFMF
jgi:hypothetical protein